MTAYQAHCNDSHHAQIKQSIRLPVATAREKRAHVTPLRLPRLLLWIVLQMASLAEEAVLAAFFAGEITARAAGPIRMPE